MKASIVCFKKNSSGDTKYDENRIPITTTVITSFPINFGYGSYNEPKKIINLDVNIEDIISIDIIDEK